MKEVQPEKALYTDAEFEQAISDGEARQAGAPVEEPTGFSVSDLRNMDAITLMRIYDLLGAILTHLDKDMADAILEAHADGKLIGPFPYLNI